MNKMSLRLNILLRLSYPGAQKVLSALYGELLYLKMDKNSWSYSMVEPEPTCRTQNKAQKMYGSGRGARVVIMAGVDALHL